MDHRVVLSVETFNCRNKTFSDTKPNTSEDIYCQKQREDIEYKIILARCDETN